MVFLAFLVESAESMDFRLLTWVGFRLRASGDFTYWVLVGVRNSLVSDSR